MPPDPVAIVDQAGSVVAVSQTLTALTGYRQEELVGETIERLMTPVLAGWLHANDASGATWTPFTLRHRDGTEIAAEVKVTPIALADRTLLCCWFRDVLEPNRIADERDQLRLAMDALLDSVYVTDPVAMRFVDANAEACRRLGYTRAELLAKGPQDVLAVDREQLKRTYQQVIVAGERGAAADVIYVTRDGRRRWTELHRRALLSNGRWLIVTVGRDITDRKQAEQSLSESEARLDRAQEIAAIGSWELEVATGSFVWSRQMYRLHGLSPEDFVPTITNLADHVHSDDCELAGQWIADLQHGAQRESVDLRIVRPDGEIRIVSVEGRAVGGPDGNARQIAGTMQDVTERRLTERQLVQAQKMEAIGNLTGGIAHDFNNVLGVIVGNLDPLARFTRDNAVAAKLCEQAHQGAQRCADLIDRLLAFARRQPLRPQRTDINDLVENVGKLLNRTLGEDIALTLDLDATPCPVVIDPTQLEAALANLATNARDAMPRGGRLRMATMKLRVAAPHDPGQLEVAPGDYVCIAVSDTGTGISPHVIGRIFEPFFTTKPPGKGTGLGLSMVFGFVQQSGGYVTVDSEPGHGSTFRIYLPLGETVESKPPVTEPDILTGGNERILVVEDNAELRGTVVLQLAALGYQVREFENADAALKAILSDEPVDLLLTDVVMPGLMDGIDLAQAATRSAPGLKVLLMSGFAGGLDDRSEARRSEYKLLHKPFRHRELARLVREVLGET
jgi:PAS domain S-box-containing protein